MEPLICLVVWAVFARGMGVLVHHTVSDAIDDIRLNNE
jgi:hypothetical protein